MSVGPSIYDSVSTLYEPVNQWKSNKRRLSWCPPHFYKIKTNISGDLDSLINGWEEQMRKIFDLIATQTQGYWYTDFDDGHANATFAFESETEAVFIGLQLG